MTYNIHPLVVHFPIAFLLLLSLLKVLPLGRWFPSIAWKQVRFVLFLAGVLGAMTASTTGEIAEHLVRPDHGIVEMHAFFASVSTWIYGLLLLGEIVALARSSVAKVLSGELLKVVIKVEQILTSPAFSILLAVLGLIAISVTGLLGGVMVYGTSADPLAPVILKLLGV